tara:strand:- start:2631 stop:3065 length:435 start_codon:yes stop_codon:yes gene_type:complete
MKEFFHKILSISMAFVVLFSTMSFTVDMHYCGDTLVDFSLISEAKSCGMDSDSYRKQQPVKSCESSTMSSKSCCTDQQIVKAGKDDLKISFDTLSFEQQTFIAAFTYSYINLFEGTESEELPFVDYPPPFIKRDVQVMHQTFLI